MLVFKNLSLHHTYMTWTWTWTCTLYLVRISYANQLLQAGENGTPQDRAWINVVWSALDRGTCPNPHVERDTWTRAVRAVGKIWAARLYGHYSSKRGAWHKILRRAQFRRRIKAIRMRTLPTWNRSTRTLTVNVKTSPLAYSRHAEMNSLLCNA